MTSNAVLPVIVATVRSKIGATSRTRVLLKSNHRRATRDVQNATHARTRLQRIQSGTRNSQSPRRRLLRCTRWGNKILANSQRRLRTTERARVRACVPNRSRTHTHLERAYKHTQIYIRTYIQIQAISTRQFKGNRVSLERIFVSSALNRQSCGHKTVACVFETLHSGSLSNVKK